MIFSITLFDKKTDTGGTINNGGMLKTLKIRIPKGSFLRLKIKIKKFCKDVKIKDLLIEPIVIRNNIKIIIELIIIKKINTPIFS